MNSSWAFRTVLGIVGLALALSTPIAVIALDSGKRTAPLYPGAVTLGEEKDCKGDTSSWHGSTCTQYSRDSLEQVKAFYDQKFGAKNFIESKATKEQKSHFAAFAWEYVIGEMGIGDEFRGVTISEKIPPAWPSSNEQANAMIQKSRFFYNLGQAVDWTGAAARSGGETRTVAQMKEVFAKYAYLEARYFADPEALNRLNKKYEDLQAQRKKAAEDQQRKDEAQLAKQQQGTMDQMAQQQKSNQRIMEGKDEQVNADRAEMDALMKRKPGLWAKAKPSYDKGNALMNEGLKDMNEAKLKQAEIEMKKANDILRADPEVAALQDKQMARQDARAKAEGGKFMQGITAMQDSATGMINRRSKANLDAVWVTWTEYLAEAAKLDTLRTEISVDFARVGSGKDYSDKPDVVAAKWKTRKWEDPGASKPGEDSGTGSSTSASRGKAVPAQNKGDGAKKDEPKKSVTDDATETAKKAGKEGLNLLKKLF